MVRNNLRLLIDERFAKQGKRVNISAIADKSHLGRQTVMQWYYEPDTLTRYDVDVLDKWCAYLKCQPGDILAYEEDKP